PIKDPQWCEFISSHPDAGPFHLPAWTSVIADCYHFDAFILTVRDTDGEILAGAPVVAVRSPLGRRRWVSLPFTDVCPLLVRSDIDVNEVAVALEEHVIASGVSGLEVRAGLPANENVHPVEVGYRHVLEVPSDPAALRPRRGQRLRRNQAMRKGVKVTYGAGPEDLAAFYRLHTLTRRRHGVPVQPRRFFDLIQARLLVPGYGFLATASLEGQVVAAAIYLSHNGILVNKYHASDPRCPDTGAGHLLDWEIMAAACTHGYHTIDMGRTDFGADGLRYYKTAWGAVEEPLVYTYICRRPLESVPGRVPGFSQKIIQHSPPWVCRALGAILYRWSA
ncbi:MAG: GNAT family N-acetyltransferase, partial [Actinomycetia bacterium]|nr:GNAT family N-acetyltransferase [Actinomycetes bacterium]